MHDIKKFQWGLAGYNNGVQVSIDRRVPQALTAWLELFDYTSSQICRIMRKYAKRNQLSRLDQSQLASRAAYIQEHYGKLHHAQHKG